MLTLGQDVDLHHVVLQLLLALGLNLLGGGQSAGLLVPGLRSTNNKNNISNTNNINYISSGWKQKTRQASWWTWFPPKPLIHQHVRTASVSETHTNRWSCDLSVLHTSSSRYKKKKAQSAACEQSQLVEEAGALNLKNLQTWNTQQLLCNQDLQ